MIINTELKKEIVLKLFKDIYSEYNPSSLSKQINRTREGTFKSLKELEENNIVKGKNFGKARFYNLEINDEFVLKNIELLLMEESRPFKRWKQELKELSKHVKIMVLFGSSINNEENAKDIDLLLVFDRKYNFEIEQIIKEKNKILIKKIHPLKQTIKDFEKNIINKDKVILDLIKKGVVLFGVEKYVGVIKNVSRK